MMSIFLFCCLTLVSNSVGQKTGVISLPANGKWDGNDGPWSSFTVYVGTPPQEVRLLPSSSGSMVWAVVPSGCNSATDPSNCTELRGSAFSSSSSTSWVEKGIYTLPLDEEQSLGYTGNGDFGFEQIAFPHSNGTTSSDVSLNNTVLAGIASKAFFMGTIGLAPIATNFTNSAAVPSLIEKLKNAGYIKSTSWGYTAGSCGRSTYGSLEFGGYDESRFVRNNLPFPMANNGSVDLVVAIQTITSGIQNLLVNGIIARLDSTVGQIWLPQTACQAFERAFGLIWDSTTNLYLVHDKLHESLLQQNPNVTFTLGLTGTSRDVISIVMPYASFDLTASWPLTTNGTNRYFPLRRAANSTQHVLGRPFFQNAYVIADYDRGNFSVFQASFPSADTPQSLVAIIPPKKAMKLPTGDIVGIVIGIILVVLVLVGTVGWWRRKRSHEARKKVEQEDREARESFIKAELDGTQTKPWQTDPKRKIRESSVSEVDGSESNDSMLKNDYNALKRLGDERLSTAEAGGTPRAELVGTEAAAELPGRRPRSLYELA